MLDSLAVFFLQLWVLTWDEVREMVFRRRAALTLLVYAGLLAISLWLLVRLQLQMGDTQSILTELISHGEQFDALLDQFHLSRAKPLIMYLAGIPNSVWLFQLISVLWYPVLITLMSYDLISHDSGRGSLRYLIQRTSRTAYFLSKFLAHLLVYGLLQMISVAILLLLSSQMDSGFQIGNYAPMSLRYFFVFLPFAACYLASTVWISSTTKRSGVSLVRIHLLWIYFIVVAAKFPWATPLNSDLTLGLMMPEHGYGVLSVAGFCGWTVAFLLLGLIPLKRRDL